MQLFARKIGWGVPSEFTGTVHSVFRGAAILTVAGRDLVTLVPSSAGGLPGAISVDLLADFDFGKALETGRGAAVRGGVLRFERNAVSVDLRAAFPWRSRLAALELDLTNIAPRRAWETAATILSADGRSEDLIGIARSSIRALVDATSGLNAAGTKHALGELVGLGAGGTPAGDDFLVGFLAGLWAQKATQSRLAFATAFGRELQPLLNRTNDVSRVYLAAAAESEVSERLTDLAAAIAAGARASVVGAAAKAAIAVGHTSGADGTLGLLLGTAAGGPAEIAGRAALLITGSPVRVEV